MKQLHISLPSFPSLKMVLGTVLFPLALSLSAQSAPSSVCRKIIDQIVQQENVGVDVALHDQHTRQFLEKLTLGGAFTDIDYKDRSQTVWKPVEHLHRMKEMVLSYISPSSCYYGNEQLHRTLVHMLQYWYDANPESTNWYFREIGWPQPMGLNLSLLRAGKQPVPKELENRILHRMKSISRGPSQPGSQGKGANKMDIALQWIYRTCLQEDEANLKFAVAQFYSPLKYNEGQGLQSDCSYLQHGMQLYTGGYGAYVLDAFFKVAFYLRGTALENTEKTRLVADFVRYGVMPTIRGNHMMYNVLGRGMTRERNMKADNYATYLDKLQLLDEANRKEYAEGARRLRGQKPASYALAPLHRHFWRGDYTLHQRRDYTVDVRMASTRTALCENGNGENLKGYFLTDGGMSVVRRGDEYLDIFPVWDWAHIPGTTTPALSQIPLPGAWEKPGQSKFAGGVSDGQYGVTAYWMDNRQFGVNTTARKSWFFFDKEVVCMGSGITSANPHPVHTTVNQSLLRGEVQIMQRGDKAPKLQPKGEHTYRQLQCVAHDGIAYYFPEGAEITLRNDVQQGTWKSINRSSSAAPVAREVFTMWQNHGVRPQHAHYLYYVIPHDLPIRKIQKRMDDMLTVNNDSIQAVYNRTLHRLGVVFYKPCTLRWGEIEVTPSHPCVVMFSDVDKKKVRVHVADPSYKTDKIAFRVKLPGLPQLRHKECQLNRDRLFVGSTADIVIE